VKPSTRIRFAARLALRRRYGYAALRVLRRAVRLAVSEHRRRTLDAERAYDGDHEHKAMRAAYNRAVRRLLASWPALSLFDPRGEP
jgi:hypothetical protein